MNVIHDSTLGLIEISEVEAAAQRGTLQVTVGGGMVKAECRRRILQIMTEDQQRNALAAGQAAMMQYGADPAGWPSDLRERQAVAVASWVEIERLRARSNEIEAMDPIPSNYADDDLWQ